MLLISKGSGGNFVLTTYWRVTGNGGLSSLAFQVLSAGGSSRQRFYWGRDLTAAALFLFTNVGEEVFSEVASS